MYRIGVTATSAKGDDLTARVTIDQHQLDANRRLVECFCINDEDVVSTIGKFAHGVKPLQGKGSSARSQLKPL